MKNETIKTVSLLALLATSGTTYADDNARISMADFEIDTQIQFEKQLDMTLTSGNVNTVLSEITRQELSMSDIEKISAFLKKYKDAIKIESSSKSQDEGFTIGPILKGDIREEQLTKSEDGGWTR